MLDGYVSEKEQMESIRKWWNNTGKYIALAVVIGLAIGAAWRYWHTLQLRRAENASVIYQSILQADSQNKIGTVQGGATILMTNFSGTAYAGLAALLFAKEAVLQNNFPLALSKLQWAVDHSAIKSIKQIAQLNAARILLSQGKTQDALMQLKIVNDKQFQPMIDWIKGDIYSKEGNAAKAKMHYEAAKKTLAGFPPAESLLTQQLAN